MITNTSDNKPLSPSILKALQDYLDIQHEERQLREEKKKLQQILGTHMNDQNITFWAPEVDGEKLAITSVNKIKIDYDEALLQERLGEKYRKILAPDLIKIGKNLETLTRLFDPVIEQIGSPTPEKVKWAVESGFIERTVFNGTYDRSTQLSVRVGRYIESKHSLQGGSSKKAISPPYNAKESSKSLVKKSPLFD